MAVIDFLRLAKLSLRPQRVLLHSFLAYLPFSFAVSRGYDLNDALIRGLLSLVHVSLCGITSATTNDFFDRFEDKGYKDNPFDTDETLPKAGLAFVLSLQALTLGFAIVVGLAYDASIIFLSTVAVILSWWYSDNTYLTRLIGFRLKRHYALELGAIVLGYVMLFASSLAINRVLILEAIPIVILVALAFARETLKKDRPQIGKDLLAGNATFPVLYGLEKTNNLILLLTFANCIGLAAFSFFGFLPLMAMLGISYFPLGIAASRWYWNHKLEESLRVLLDLNPYFLLVSIGILVG